MRSNESRFSNSLVDAVVATGARLLVRQEHWAAASILANSSAPKLTHLDHDNWNGGQDTWRLKLVLPAEVFVDLGSRREEIEEQINGALRTAMETVSECDFISAKITPALNVDPDWRGQVRQHLSGEGITNQGRVRSDNIAARQHDGLLFRSRPEIEFYNALKATGLPFAPLAVVLRGGAQRQRVEPDFIVVKDGDLYHTETPAAAHARLKFLLDEGARLERINASECDTPEKAREAVARVITTVDKLRGAR